MFKIKKLACGVVGDFKRGLQSMLSVRGESILSWIGDDNFIVEDETAANPEVIGYLNLFLMIITSEYQITERKGLW